MSYTTCVDIAKDPKGITPTGTGGSTYARKIVLSVGHDEYWSQEMRDAVTAARDAGVNLGFFTANSMINGCLLTGPCQGGGGEGPFPPGFTPTPGIQDEVTLIDDGLLPPPEFGNEDVIDDNNEATDEGTTSPIEPPNPLFDTSALGGQGDVDDPVSGSGNPALMETPATCPAGGSQPTVPCKEEKQQ